MKSLYTYTAQVDSDGIYFVRDAMTNRTSIGRVARVGRTGWCAIPTGEQITGGGPRTCYPTRAQAAHALARYTDSGDRNWISPAALAQLAEVG